ncbi:head-tail connector protein [Rhodobacter sp. 24-YEA-8]|uniref:head-tail connector protein n=1 Tax=Rhodobacter sp. 24-YEA-8 TaxID=1884310 RepID=UPI00089AE171|nr:head-tail connector protein [Rhodobacter sp. 24-YEA-8]SEB79245.1 Phage gp6-like head-tail connector protein [Rhodobacter sp. 24-YEA-8]
MNIPVRTKAPANPVVSLEDLKLHLRVEGGDQDDLIKDLEVSAVSMLDGYRGELGRCIMEQEWSVSFGEAGTFRLPFPDVSAVSAKDGAGNEVAASVAQDALGSVVTIAAPATVAMTIALPDDAIGMARILVKMLVGHWFENREAVITGTISTKLPLSAESLIERLRVSRL